MEGRAGTRRIATAVSAVVLLATGLAACGEPDAAVAPDFSYDVRAIDPSNMRPYDGDSIWNRPVPEDATFAEVASSIFAAPDVGPTRAGLDLVAVCAVDPESPLVDIEQSAGWAPADRRRSTGTVLYQRHLADSACTDLSTDPLARGLFVLIDRETGRADVGIGGWREEGGPLLQAGPDAPDARGIDVLKGDGVVGYGRASGLPALGGLVRSSELGNVVDHALALLVPAAGLSSARPHVWPARSADPSAALTYRGTNPDYALGTLLAVPGEVDVESIAWHTPQGRVLARAAQKYGMYVVDTLPTTMVQVAFGTTAARDDLGLALDPTTGAAHLDPARVDAEGVSADVLQILHLTMAVTSNAP